MSQAAAILTDKNENTISIDITREDQILIWKDQRTGKYREQILKPISKDNQLYIDIADGHLWTKGILGWTIVTKYYK